MALNSSSNSLGRITTGSQKSIDIVKKYFFDRERVMRAAERAQVRLLSKFGAFVRTTAQRSMRQRKKGSSEPGQPPLAHSGELRKLLFFSFDPITKTVVVGPLGFKKSDVPHLHEFGGVAIRKGKPAKYPARPYMKPAMLAELPKFASLFRGQIGE